ncbi:MAG TPA: permease prefix domain 1-containing protein [Pyrinomonadaceae bacterium]|nr:permease prefix domain 1-containing protein [Pyrinomonadaceae bacterium]
MNFFIGPFRRLDSRRDRLEIEEELQFHLDLLAEEHCRQNIPWEQAQATALKRFGNVEQIRDECARIARRNQPAIVALKWLFGFIFVGGVLVRICSPEYHLTRVGDILMAVGALSRLLLYLRGIYPSRYGSKPDDSVSLKLNDSPLSFASYDQRGRTPIERVFSSK